jgi:hypothetical protein
VRFAEFNGLEGIDRGGVLGEWRWSCCCHLGFLLTFLVCHCPVKRGE